MRNRRGPATVTGSRKSRAPDGRRPLGMTQSPREGAADYPGSQETCPRPANTTLEERVAQMPRITPTRLAAACALVRLTVPLARPGRARQGLPREAAGDRRRRPRAGRRERSDPDDVGQDQPRRDLLRRRDRRQRQGGLDQGEHRARAARRTPRGGPRSCGRSRSATTSTSASPSAGSGSSVAGGSVSWYLKIDHKSQQVERRRRDDPAAATKCSGRWRRPRAPSFNYPNELALVAPRAGAAPAGRSRSTSSPTTKRAGAGPPRVRGSPGPPPRPTRTGGRS